MMALVRGVISGRMVSAVIFWLTGSTSAMTGVAPRMTMQEAEAMKVRLVVMTSSPGPIPRAYRASSSATVPLARAMACLTLQWAANSFSNSRPSVPVQ